MSEGSVKGLKGLSVNRPYARSAKLQTLQTLHSAVLADRVMRARRTSTCPVCRGPILPGQQIARCGTWQHVEHVIERQRQAAREAR